MKLRSKKDGTIINVPSELEDQVRAVIEAGGDPTELLQDNQMAKGGMIKRADGSYSRRGLWDNIRAKAAANKKAGKKGKKPTKAMLEQEAEIRAAEKAYGGYMASGGCMECGGMMEIGGKLPKELLKARLESHMSSSEAQDYLDNYAMGGMLDQAGDGKWIQKATASIKRRGTEGVCTGSKFGGPSCPPGSKRYNLAKTFRKMAKSRKDDGGYNLPIAQNSIDPTLIGQNDNFDFSQQGLVRANPFVSNVPLQQPSSIFAPKPAMSDREKELRSVAGIYSPEGQEEFDFSKQGLVKPNPFVGNVLLPKPYEPISEARQKQVRDMIVLDPSQLKKFEDGYFPNNLNDNLPYRPGAFQSDDNVPYTYSGSQSDEVPFMRTRTGTESPDNTPAPNELVQSARRMGKKERRKFFADYNEGLRNEKQAQSSAPAQPTAKPTIKPRRGFGNFKFDFSQLGNFNPLSMLMGSLSGINFGNPYYNRIFGNNYNPYIQYGYNQYYKDGGILPVAGGGIELGLPTAPTIEGNEISLGQGSDYGSNFWNTGYNVTGQQPSDNQLAPKEYEWKVGDSEQSRFSSEPIKKDYNFGAFASIGQLPLMGLNAVKGTLLNKGIEKTNRKVAEMQLKNQQMSMAETSPAPNYETQGYSWQGRNALNSTAYGGYAADGMQIKQIGGMGEPNVEVEGREHIKLPNGFSQEIQGKSHAQGGIPLNLPQGTQIFSEKLKVEISFLKELAELNPDYQFLKSISLPKSGKISYADLAKKFETKKYVDLMNSKSADSIQMATAQMMIAQNTAKLEKIFMLQEQNKISGVHGPMVQQKAMEERQESEAQEQAEQQQEPEEPMMAHGGYHLPSYENAGQTDIDYSNWTGETFKTREGIITPTNVDLNIDPKATWSRFAKKYGPLDKRITKKQTREAIAALQENIYDDYLDTEHGREALNKMWQEFGVTNQMEEKYGDIAKKIKNKEKLSLDDLNRLRANYIDSYAGKRLPEYLEPRIYTPNIKGPTSSAPEETAPPTPEQMQAKQDQFPGISLNVAANLPMAISRDALNFYKLTPQYIDPRYLDIQPQLNRISRSRRAVQSNIGSRGSADIANLLGAQANADIAAGEAFGQKYVYDRAQDAAAQQANAQAKMDTDKYNQQAWFQQLEDPIRRREGAIDTWQRAKAEQQDEYRQKMAQYYNNLDFMQRTLPYFQNMDAKQAYEYANLMGTAANPFLGEQATTKKKRNGGKVKIKPKFKK